MVKPRSSLQIPSIFCSGIGSFDDAKESRSNGCFFVRDHPTIYAQKLGPLRAIHMSDANVRFTSAIYPCVVLHLRERAMSNETATFR